MTLISKPWELTYLQKYAEFNLFSLGNTYIAVILPRVNPDSFLLENLFPDASSTFSPNTSSVVFTTLWDSSYIVVLEDYRQHTFFSGLASVGGIFTIVDGIFAMIFGMGLISILFGLSYHSHLLEQS